jgi:hypothetical protein
MSTMWANFWNAVFFFTGIAFGVVTMLYLVIAPSSYEISIPNSNVIAYCTLLPSK